MFVGERMSRPVISVSPETRINDVLAMFRKEHIRRAPVMKDGKLVGIVSERDLLNATPSSVTTLSVWELNYLISKVTIKDVMAKNVVTVEQDTPIEEAARIMADQKIGGVPVMSGENVVGIITEADLFKIFLELIYAVSEQTEAGEKYLYVPVRAIKPQEGGMWHGHIRGRSRWLERDAG